MGRFRQDLFEERNDDEGHVEGSGGESPFEVNAGESGKRKQISDEIFEVFPHGLIIYLS